MRQPLLFFTCWAIAGLAADPHPAARAAGGMDPGYREVMAEADRATGRGIDWTVRVRSVQKKFYTYTLEADYLPPPEEGPCENCRLTVRYRSRTEETTRPSRFKPGQVLAVRGTVLSLDPHPVVLASLIQTR